MVQLDSTPEDRLARLRASLGEDPKVSRSADRMQRNRPSNVLVGATLHAAARQDQGLPLSDLEQDLVDVLRVFVSDSEIAASGQAWRQAAPRTAAQLFPDCVAGLAVETAYTFEDLAADLPSLAAGILAQPNVNIVNVADLPADGSVDTSEAVAAMAEYGGSAVTVLSGPVVDAESRAAMVALNFEAVKFQCVRDTNDQWGGRDEIYWVSAAGSDIGYRASYRSQVFGELATGQERAFPAGTSLFTGSIYQSLMVNIHCWERDQGGIFDELQQQMWKISQKCADAAVSIIENGEKEDAALAAVIAVVAALVAWLLGWLTNDDDLVGERSIAISAGAVRLLTAADPATPGVDAVTRQQWDFSSSEGHYRLHTETSPAADQNLYTMTWDAERGWGNASAVPVGRVMDGAPSVGTLKGVLHLLQREPRELYNPFVAARTFDGVTWSETSGTEIQSVSPLSPLATLGDKVYCYYQHNDGRGTMLLAVDNGLGWTSPSRGGNAGYGTTTATPGLAAFNGKLYCYARSSGFAGSDGSYTCKRFTPATDAWDTAPGIPGSNLSEGGPALAEHMGKLHCVFRGRGNELYWATFDGSTWTSRGQLAATTTAAPALVTRDNVLYCYILGPGDSGDMLWSTYQGTSWTPFEKIPTSGLASHAPAVALLGNDFHLFYRAKPPVKHSDDIALTKGNAASGWTFPKLPWPGSKTPDAPALATHNGTLYCAVRGLGDQVFVSRLDAGGWTAFGQVPGATTKDAPQLASFKGYLFLTHLGLDGLWQYLSHSTNGADWTPPAPLSSGNRAAAMAVRNDALHYATTLNNRVYFSYSSTPTGTWPQATEVPGVMTFTAPALATHNNTLYLAHLAPDDHVYVTTHNGQGWSTPQKIHATTSSPPALGVRGDTLYCAVRGGDNRIWLSSLTGGSWSSVQPLTTAGTTLSRPAIAAPNTDDLYIVYRSTDA